MTTWLSDLSANRHIKTYVKDFLDVSGNMTVRQSDDYKWNSYGQLIKGVHEVDNATQLGFSVGLDSSGTTMIVGAINQDGGSTGTDGGVAFVYRYDETTNLWYQLGDTLTSSTAVSYGQYVDINDAGNRVMTGDTAANSLYIYDLSGTNWVNIGTITQHSLDYTGGRMSGDGNTIVFTNYPTDTQYMYRYDGTTWLAIGTITGGSNAAYSPNLSYDGNRVTYGDAGAAQVKVYDYSGGITWTQVGSTLTSPVSSSNFGTTSDLSKDGSIVAVGSSSKNLVAVYQFSNDTNDWVQMGSLLVSPGGFDSGTQYGTSVRLSDDGLTLAVTEFYSDSDTGLSDTGALFVYKYINGDWEQQGSTVYGAVVDARIGLTIGRGMDINGDGTKIAVGAYYAFGEDGYAQVFQWSQASFENPMLDVSGNELSVWADAESNPANYRSEQVGDTQYSDKQFGATVSMNKDGTIMCTGSPQGNSNSGSVRIFKWRNGSWEWLNGLQLQPFADITGGYFGTITALSHDGLTIAGGYNKDTTGGYGGAVGVWSMVNGSWVQKGNYIEGTNTGDQLGFRGLDMNGDGTIVATFGSLGWAKIFQYSEDTNTWTQMGGDLTVGATSDSALSFTRRVSLDEAGTTVVVGDPRSGTYGETKIYKFIDGSWTQLGSTIDGDPGTSSNGTLEGCVTRLSADGTIVATGSRFYSRDGNTGEDGYLRVFKYVEARGDWVQMGSTLYGDAGAADNFAYSMDMSSDGKTLAVGAPYADHRSANCGATYVYKYIDSLGDWMLLSDYHPGNTNRGFTQVNSNEYQGMQTALSGDGTRFATGSYLGLKVTVYDVIFEPAFKVSDTEIRMTKPTYIRDLHIPAWTNHAPTIFVETWNNANALVFRSYDNGTVKLYAASYNIDSDDRIKGDEVLITNATDTLMKLRPQTYKKYSKFDCSGTYMVESGLIAQDIWYNTPELRHLVSLPMNAEPLPLPEGIDTTHDIQNDPDYTNLGWGNNAASVNYTQLISFLIQSNQEQQELLDTQKTQIEDLITRVTALENPATV